MSPNTEPLRRSWSSASSAPASPVIWCGPQSEAAKTYKMAREHVLDLSVVIPIRNEAPSLVAGVHLHDYGCSLKAFRAEIVKGMKLYGEMHRFLPAIASEQTSSISERVVNHRPRRYGRSKYGIGRTIRVILDLLTVKFLLSYSTRPLPTFGLVRGTIALV